MMALATKGTLAVVQRVGDIPYQGWHRVHYAATICHGELVTVIGWKVPEKLALGIVLIPFPMAPVKP
jgi:hypothetical protein